MQFPINVSIYIGFEDIFDETPPQNRLTLLDGYSKRSLLGIFSLINNHPKKSLISHEIPHDTQMEIVYKLCLPDTVLFDKLFSKLRKLLGVSDRPAALFHRTALVIALNEILESEDLPHDSDKELSSEAIIKYFLLINSTLKTKQDSYSSSVDSFIDLYPVLVTSNEHNTPFTPFMDLFRGIHLANFFEQNMDLGDEFKAYFTSIGFAPQVYLPLVFSHIIPLSNKNIDDPPIFKPDNDVLKKIVEKLSNNELISSNLIEVLNLRGNPFYQWDDSRWLLLDVPFLIDNCFYYIINSFWFNYLKPKGIISHKRYFSIIGEFYENYIARIIHRSFHFLKHPGPKTLDELIVKHPIKKTDIEIADIYVRQNKKVLIAEIKSTSFGTNFKYASDLIKSFEENQSRFEKDFGITQIANGVENFLRYPELIERKLKKGSNYKIFPAIIFNEKFFHTPFSNLVFNSIFYRKLKEKFSDIIIPSHEHKAIRYKKTIIYPLILIHSSDLEILEPELVNRKVEIWDLFKKHYEKSKLHDSFYSTVYSNISLDSVDYNMNIIRPILEEFDNRKKH